MWTVVCELVNGAIWTRFLFNCHGSNYPVVRIILYNILTTNMGFYMSLLGYTLDGAVHIITYPSAPSFVAVSTWPWWLFSSWRWSACGPISLTSELLVVGRTIWQKWKLHYCNTYNWGTKVANLFSIFFVPLLLAFRILIKPNQIC